MLQDRAFRETCKDSNFTNMLHRQQFFHWYSRQNMERLKNLQAHIDNTILVTPGSSSTTIVLNRPSSLNSLTIEMIMSISRAIKPLESESKELLLIGAGSRAFCAGGDVVAIANNSSVAIEFFSNEFRLFYDISRVQSNRCAVLRGYVMGGGVGLSLACNVRIATPSTVWAMPENIIGLVPDVGSSYYLSRLSPPSVGLYLMLTGTRLSGADTFFLGLATHYLASDELVDTLSAEIAQGSGVKVVADRYHKAPDRASSKMLGHTEEIETCFKNAANIEEIYERLTSLNTPWAHETMRVLSQQCPLSLVLALHLFKQAKHQSYAGCLELEFNLVIQLTVHRNYNFVLGVNHRLVHKEKTTPPWEPSHYSNVTEAMVGIAFRNEEGPKLQLSG
mmetsp:Transcript_26289/g.47094  ORF Transcript_26289/g.47094 Transcript_26289/m.47094 type:complete len:391 (+) Transcript_26289:255-1427(+)